MRYRPSVSLDPAILGDPGAVSRAGKKARRKFSSPTDRPWVSEDEIRRDICLFQFGKVSVGKK